MIDTLKSTLEELQEALTGADENALRKVRRALRLVPELEKIWRCFYCGFEATKEVAARAHFGDDAGEVPLCRSWDELNADGRAAEFQSLTAALNAERDENQRLRTANEGLEYRVDSHDVEIASRFKGARSINDVWNQLDSMEGRALAAEEARDAFYSRIERLTLYAEKLERELQTPELHDFMVGAVAEAQHQRFRWGSDHDAGKEPQDWFWLLGYLGGKALKAHVSGDTEKALHHTISSAACLANWHAAILGKTNMRPGIDPHSIVGLTDEDLTAGEVEAYCGGLTSL